MAPHKKGRKAKQWPGSWDDLFALVYYNADTGEVETMGPYKSNGVTMKDGHLHLPIPVGSSLGEAGVERGERHTEYFRADHVCWMLVTGHWPTGWMEHINGLKLDVSLDNLVHCDENADRWWFGSQAPGTPRELVMVDAENGKQSVGPITLRVTWGQDVKVMPQINHAYRTIEQVEADVDPHKEDLTYQKGEFGIDWGLHDDPEEELEHDD